MLKRGLISHKKYVLSLLLVFLVIAGFLAIGPYDRYDWALENGLVAGFLVVAIFTYKKLPLSRLSYTLIFIFLVIHEIGAHYTYSLVPYDDWFASLFGVTFNEVIGWERNNYDRLVHFSYGLLLAYPLREVFFRVARAEGFWGYFLPLDFTMSTSMLYELIEWGAAEFFGGELGAAYLGTQGDIWDAQKDMALASLGAVVAMLLTLCINAWLKKDFAREWAESLRVKHHEPMGEETLVKILGEKARRE